MTSTPPAQAESAGPAQGRVEAFSDGVFAVAITLLVLDVTLAVKAEPGRRWLGQPIVWTESGAIVSSSRGLVASAVPGVGLAEVALGEGLDVLCRAVEKPATVRHGSPWHFALMSLT